jgi:hypothetical protein
MPRTVDEVMDLRDHAGGGCCDRFADRKACDCLEEATMREDLVRMRGRLVEMDAAAARVRREGRLEGIEAARLIVLAAAKEAKRRSRGVIRRWAPGTEDERAAYYEEAALLIEGLARLGD